MNMFRLIVVLAIILCGIAAARAAVNISGQIHALTVANSSTRY